MIKEIVIVAGIVAAGVVLGIRREEGPIGIGEFACVLLGLSLFIVMVVNA